MRTLFLLLPLLAACPPSEPKDSPAAEGCDDTDFEASELCNGVDDNCNGQVDEAPIDAPFWYADQDADGYGDEAAAQQHCAAPEAFVARGGDCDDSNASVFPDAVEVCNGSDDDCDGDVDTDAADLPAWYLDDDNDGFGGALFLSCTPPAGYIAAGGDCDDSNPAISPAATELCNGVDDDCLDTTPDLGIATFWDSAGQVQDLTALLSGTEDAPSMPLLNTAGTLSLCPRTWYVNAEIQADVRIQAVGTGVILDAGGAGSALQISADGVRVELSGLSITGGSGSWVESEPGVQARWGGGILCRGGENPPELVGEDLEIYNNQAEAGGGILAESCTLSLSRVRIEDNRADSSGGLGVSEGTATVEDSEILSNEAVDTAGGVGVGNGSLLLRRSTLSNNMASAGGAGVSAFSGLDLEDCTVDSNDADQGGAFGVYIAALSLHNTVVSNNTATTSSAIDTYGASITAIDSLIVDNQVDPGGAAIQLGSASFTCTGSSAVQAGLLRNSGGVGAVLLAFGSTLDAVSCDFGEAVDDNSPTDLYLDSTASTVSVGDDATLSCTDFTCSP